MKATGSSCPSKSDSYSSWVFSGVGEEAFGIVAVSTEARADVEAWYTLAFATCAWIVEQAAFVEALDERFAVIGIKSATQHERGNLTLLQ